MTRGSILLNPWYQKEGVVLVLIDQRKMGYGWQLCIGDGHWLAADEIKNVRQCRDFAETEQYCILQTEHNINHKDKDR